MQVQGLALNLRTRGMHEAGDLGVRLVQAHWRDVWRVYAPLYLGCAALCACLVPMASWLPMLVLFWIKPVLDRALLHVYARAAFGERSSFGTLMADARRVLFTDLLVTLLWRRFSPWRSYTQPIYQLEGQRGSGRSSRRRQLLRSQRGVASLMHLCFAHAEAVLMLGLLALGVLLAPQGSGESLMHWMTADTESAVRSLLNLGAYALTVLFLEPFYVASGFAMYLNRRVELEAWDVEQEFRRAFGS